MRRKLRARSVAAWRSILVRRRWSPLRFAWTLAIRQSTTAPKLAHHALSQLVHALESPSRGCGCSRPCGSSDTCAPSCSLRGGRGCYAESGPINWFWRRVKRNDLGMSWQRFLSAIRSLPQGQLSRHNQAGDLPDLGEGIDREMLRQLTDASSGRRGFTFARMGNRGIPTALSATQPCRGWQLRGVA